MRKSLAAMLVTVVLALAVIPSAWREIDSGKEAIFVTEEILSGDPAAAEGVRLEIASHWDRRLLWDTLYTVGDGNGAQTSFRFSSQQVYWDSLFRKNACLVLHYGDSFTMDGGNLSPGGYGEITRALEEEWNQTGTVQTDTIRIGDYYEYYPLTMNIENSSVTYEDHFNNNLYSEYLTEFFHISTAEDRMELTLEKDPEGKLVSVIGQRQSADAGDTQILLTDTCAFAENGFYYAYVCENPEGKVLDRGQETGIFFFPYRMEKDVIYIELAQVRKVQEQPEGWNPVQMLLDEEEEYLYLAAIGEEGYTLFVYSVDGEDLTPAGQIPLRQRETAAEEALPYFRQMTAEEGGLLITWSDNSFVFLTGEGGSCRKWCSGVFPRYMAEPENAGTESDNGAFAGGAEDLQEKERPFPMANACAFDGERLVLAGFETEESLNVLLAVYDESGERFSGLYRHSSELDADTDQYGRRRILSQVNRNWMFFGARQIPVSSPLKITIEK